MNDYNYDLCKYRKEEKKKIPYLKIILYGVALGITLNAMWDQWFGENVKEIKIEQVGKSIDDCFE